MTIETFFTNFAHLADAPNGVQKLRELILQLAVQGKLVPQDPSDEPSSIALEQIRKQRKKLIKEKVIRKQTELESISVGELPYSIPQGWAWTRLGELVVSQTDDFVDGPFGSNLKASEYQDSGVPIIRIQNVDRNRFKDKQIKFLTPKKAEQLKRHSFVAGDIVINKLGAPVGKACIIPSKFEYGIIVADLVRIRLNEKLFDARYITYAINSGPVITQFTGEITGITRDRVNLTKMRNLLFPIPPLAEQNRIVTKVDQLMALCNELEARQQKQQQGRVRLNNAALDALLTARESDEFADHWQRISTNFDLLYDHPETIAKLRAAILQLAVQGKLVPQDPSDEPASVLLERIKAEKERLVKDFKVRKPKPPSPIKDGQLPFSLPNGWSWLRLEDCGVFLGGGTPSKQKTAYWEGDVPWVSPKDMKVQYISDSIDHVSEEAIENSSAKLIPEGALLMVVRGMILLHSFPVAKTTREVTVNQDMKVLISALPDVSEYLLKVLIAEKGRVLDLVERSSHGTCRLDTDSLLDLVIALPPLEEQKRIVAKVDQLMCLCEELEAKLKQTQQHSEKLMEATVRQLLVA